MDGLLFDTEAVFFEAMRAAGAERGCEISWAFFLSLLGLAREHNYRRLREHFGGAFAAEDFHAQCHLHFARLVQDGLRLKPGVIELLDHLDHRRLPRAIATSSARASAERQLARFALARRFDVVIAHGDYRQGKPHPAPYLAAAKALAVDPASCLALEDSHNGVRGAAAAGMMPIMVPDILPPTSEMESLAIGIARDLHEVRAWLETAA